MFVPDVNLLVYAVDASSPHHPAAAGWWRGQLGGTEPVGLPWVTTLGFLRLTTNSRMYDAPLSPGAASDLIRGWLAFAHVVPIEPTSDHFARLTRLLADTGAQGNLVTDAHLAALAMGHGATLASADADFTRFTGLRLINPLTG